MRIAPFLILFICANAFAMGKTPPRPTFEQQVQRCVDIFPVDVSECGFEGQLERPDFPEEIWFTNPDFEKCSLILKREKCKDKTRYDRCVQDAKEACKCGWSKWPASCDACFNRAEESCR